MDLMEPGRALNRDIAAGEAENRVRESLALRGGGLPRYTYPGRAEDLETMRRYHGEHGVPPAGYFRRLLWRLGGAA